MKLRKHGKKWNIQGDVKKRNDENDDYNDNYCEVLSESESLSASDSESDSKDEREEQNEEYEEEVCQSDGLGVSGYTREMLLHKLREKENMLDDRDKTIYNLTKEIVLHKESTKDIITQKENEIKNVKVTIESCESEKLDMSRLGITKRDSLLLSINTLVCNSFLWMNEYSKHVLDNKKLTDDQHVNSIEPDENETSNPSDEQVEVSKTVERNNEDNVPNSGAKHCEEERNIAEEDNAECDSESNVNDEKENEPDALRFDWRNTMKYNYSNDFRKLLITEQAPTTIIQLLARLFCGDYSHVTLTELRQKVVVYIESHGEVNYMHCKRLEESGYVLIRSSDEILRLRTNCGKMTRIKIEIRS